MEQMGLLHLYYGDGKGKTTAAMGLALRALGSGKRVVIVQFLKGGRSGEIPLLEQLGAKVFRGKAGQKFVSQMNEAEKAATRALQDANLAAAMAEPADLLILDEATSSIDTRTETLVQRGMDALMKGRTTFVIAHRLSTVKNSDCIMVLEQGRIIERGTHDQLIAQKGRYYTLYTGNAIGE